MRLWVVLVSLAVLLCCAGALRWVAVPSTAPAGSVQAERRPARTTVRVLRDPGASVAFTRRRAPAVPAAEATGVPAPGPAWDGGDAPSRDFVRARVVALVAAREPDHPLRSAELELAVHAALRQFEAEREILAPGFQLTPEANARRVELRDLAARAADEVRESLGFAPPDGEVVGVLEKEIERALLLQQPEG